MYLYTGKNWLNFVSHPPPDPDTGFLLKYSATLQNRTFFTIWLISRGRIARIFRWVDAVRIDQGRPWVDPTRPGVGSGRVKDFCIIRPVGTPVEMFRNLFFFGLPENLYAYSDPNFLVNSAMQCTIHNALFCCSLCILLVRVKFTNFTFLNINSTTWRMLILYFEISTFVITIHTVWFSAGPD